MYISRISYKYSDNIYFSKYQTEKVQIFKIDIDVWDRLFSSRLPEASPHTQYELPNPSNNGESYIYFSYNFNNPCDSEM